MCNYKFNVDDRGETLVNYGSPKILCVALIGEMSQFVLSCRECDKADPPHIVIGVYACLACKLKMGDIIISIG